MGPYCSRCFIRLGSAEKRVTIGTKIFHTYCAQRSDLRIPARPLHLSDRLPHQVDYTCLNVIGGHQ